MGCNIEFSFNRYGTMDGFIAAGKSAPTGGVMLDTYGDHRILGGLFAAALGARESVTIKGAENMDAGYPGFFEQISNAGALWTQAGSGPRKFITDTTRIKS
jgi:5-enolpyruvylshikimate-3-phosphate synthase